MTKVVELIFSPSEEQKRLKSSFWAVVADYATIDVENIKLVDVKQVTGDTRCESWWRQPGFQEWFANKDEYRQQLEYEFSVALATLNDVMTDRDAPANARVRAAEIVARLANKEPAKTKETKWADKDIGEMDTKQLDALIKKLTPKQA